MWENQSRPSATYCHTDSHLEKETPPSCDEYNFYHSGQRVVRGANAGGRAQ